MAKSAKNDRELIQIFKPMLKEAVEYVLDKVLEANEDKILEKVYGAGEPEVYDRSYEFLKAWDKAVHTASHLGHDVEGSFYYNPSSMTVGSTSPDAYDFAQHIGVGGEYMGRDAREYLADIIYQGMAGDLFGRGYWTKRRDAFSALVKYVGKERFDKWMMDGFRKAGVTPKRGVGIVQTTR